MNPSAETWRELLGELTALPAERQRVAEALGVNAYTVTRWVEDKADPRATSLKNLPDVFPSPYREQLAALIQADFFPHMTAGPLPSAGHPQADEVPVEHLARTLAAYASIGGRFRAWSIRNLILQWAIGQLDSDQMGVQLTVVQCVPPRPEQSVRTLCERMSVGTALWDSGVRSRLSFLGAESLCGWTVGRGEPGVVQDTEQNRGSFPVRPDPDEKSAATWPFQREGKLAGCLLVSSHQVNYFTPLRLSWIEIYANALALSFRDEEFYDLRQIALHEIPELAQQQEYTSLTRLRDRVTSLRRERMYQLSEAEAETLVLQEMEAELLDRANSMK
jgi:hypothetical protein